MLDDLYQADTDRALDNLAAMPPDKPKPQRKWNGWSAPLRGVPAGVAESVASGIDLLGGLSKVDVSPNAMAAQTPDELREIQKKARETMETGFRDNDVARSLRNTAEYYKPDPNTAGLAERLTFDLSRFVTKAVGHTVLGGGPVGAATLAVDEGLTVSDDLAQQGVDLATRTKVGALAGAAAGAGVLLPVAAPASIAKTVGLWAVGGPGAFVAQQAATREILREANYTQLAEQYDPLDLTGLVVSSLIPAGFAGHAVMRARGAKAAATPLDAPASALKPETEVAVAPKAESPALTPEQVDAVMTHNLTLAQDVRDATPPAEAVRQLQGVAKPDALDTHIGRLPEAAREPMLRLYDKAAEIKSSFDGHLRAVADAVGGTVKAAELKSSERAVDKVLGDYGGDPSRIKDLVRGTVVVKSLEDVELAISNLREKFEVLDTGFRNGLGEAAGADVTGYRDVKMNVRIDGHVAEVQINLPEMLAAKKVAHKLYKQAAAMARKVEAEGRDQTPQERQTANALLTQQRGIYEAAWNEAASSRKRSSETTPPLRIAESQGNLREPGSQAVATNPSTVTGTPSTSKNSVSGGKEAGGTERSVLSMESILPESSLFGDSAQRADVAAMIRSVQGRAAQLESQSPDMVVRTSEEGKAVTVAEEMARIRKEAQEGTDAELGSNDAGLLEIAANCALAIGTL